MINTINNHQLTKIRCNKKIVTLIRIVIFIFNFTKINNQIDWSKEIVDKLENFLNLIITECFFILM